MHHRELKRAKVQSGKNLVSYNVPLIAPLLVLVLDGAFVILIIVRPTEKLPVTDRRTDNYF